MATVREWLNEAGINWSTTVIVAHHLAEDSYSAGWGEGVAAFRFDFSSNLPASAEVLQLLDTNFDNGFGAPQAPRFVADDGTRLFFPSQYDGSTSLEYIYKDINKYMDVNYQTPYPGG